MKKHTYIIILFILISNSCRKPSCREQEPEPPVEEPEVCEKITNWEVSSGVAPDHLIEMYFRSASLGYVGGYSGVLMKTIDGGENFQALNIGTTEDVNALYFADDTIGFVATNVRSLSSGVSHLYRTIDGGQTFTGINIGAAMYYRGIYMLNKSKAFAGGGLFPWSPTVDGILMKTNDGGNNWTQVNIPGLKPITEIFFLNDQLGFTCGDQGQIFRTMDGGDNWTNITPNVSPVNGIQDIVYLDIEFLDANTGFCVGSSKSYAENFILKTTNGGLSWSRMPGVPTGQATEYYQYSVTFVDESIGYITAVLAATGEGVILTTTDGGNTWTKDYSSLNNLIEVSRMDCSTLFIVGVNGTFMKSIPD